MARKTRGVDGKTAISYVAFGPLSATIRTCGPVPAGEMDRPGTSDACEDGRGDQTT